MFKNIANIKVDSYALEIPRMKKHMKNVTKYINDHDGWNIYGWYKYGERNDAAMDDVRNPDIFTVISSTARFHISYLYPAKSDDDFLTKLVYKF